MSQCDAYDTDSGYYCLLPDDHEGLHEDPGAGKWSHRPSQLLAEYRPFYIPAYKQEEDFPCCGPNGCGHGAEQVAATIAGELAALQSGDAAHRRWLKRARMARRTVT